MAERLPTLPTQRDARRAGTARANLDDYARIRGTNSKYHHGPRLRSRVAVAVIGQIDPLFFFFFFFFFFLDRGLSRDITEIAATTTEVRHRGLSHARRELMNSRGPMHQMHMCSSLNFAHLASCIPHLNPFIYPTEIE